MMTPGEPGADEMAVRNPYAALARKWQALADVSRPDERAALSLMVADLWKTIDQDARMTAAPTGPDPRTDAAVER